MNETRNEPYQMLKMSNTTYDRLKWVVLYLLPALGTLYTGIGSVWGLPAVEEVATTIFAVATFLGVTLGISNHAYRNSPSSYDGVMLVEKDEAEDKELYKLEMFDYPENLAEKDNINFKVMESSGDTPQEIHNADGNTQD